MFSAHPVKRAEPMNQKETSQSPLRDLLYGEKRERSNSQSRSSKPSVDFHKEDNSLQRLLQGKQDQNQSKRRQRVSSDYVSPDRQGPPDPATSQPTNFSPMQLEQKLGGYRQNANDAMQASYPQPLVRQLLNFKAEDKLGPSPTIHKRHYLGSNSGTSSQFNATVLASATVSKRTSARGEDNIQMRNKTPVMEAPTPIKQTHQDDEVQDDVKLSGQDQLNAQWRMSAEYLKNLEHPTVKQSANIIMDQIDWPSQQAKKEVQRTYSDAQSSVIMLNNQRASDLVTAYNGIKDTAYDMFWGDNQQQQSFENGYNQEKRANSTTGGRQQIMQQFILEPANQISVADSADSQNPSRQQDRYFTPGKQRRPRANEISFLKNRHSMLPPGSEWKSRSVWNTSQGKQRRGRNQDRGIEPTKQVRITDQNEDVIDYEVEAYPVRHGSRSRSAKKNSDGKSILFFDSSKSVENNPCQVVCNVRRESRNRSRQQALYHMSDKPNNLPWNSQSTQTGSIANQYASGAQRARSRSGNKMTNLTEKQIKQAKDKREKKEFEQRSQLSNQKMASIVASYLNTRRTDIGEFQGIDITEDRIRQLNDIMIMGQSVLKNEQEYGESSKGGSRCASPAK